MCACHCQEEKQWSLTVTIGKLSNEQFVCTLTINNNLSSWVNRKPTNLNLENKGIAFKARMACTTQYKQGRDHYLSGMTRP